MVLATELVNGNSAGIPGAEPQVRTMDLFLAADILTE
jgi:hypothetical protein